MSAKKEKAKRDMYRLARSPVSLFDDMAAERTWYSGFVDKMMEEMADRIMTEDAAAYRVYLDENGSPQMKIIGLDEFLKEAK